MQATYPNRDVTVEIEDWFRKDTQQGGRGMTITIVDSVENEAVFVIDWTSVEKSIEFCAEFDEVKTYITSIETRELIQKYSLFLTFL